jgi:probable rRNA maturation factor
VCRRQEIWEKGKVSGSSCETVDRKIEYGIVAIEFQNLTKKEISTKRLRAVACMVLQKEKRPDALVSVVFVGAAKMRNLNKVYRKKDKATNVLAFPGGKEALGEIVLCPLVIRKDALEYKISFTRTVSWMFIHGLLHLLGYDHKTTRQEQRMTQKEQQYLSSIS